MPFVLFFDEDGVRADMRTCRTRDPTAFNYIIALLSEWRGQMALSADFVLPGVQDEVIEDVAWIESLAAHGINATRVKLWSIRAWRLILFVDHRRGRAALAAIMHRDQDYENDAALWERLKDAYARLGF